MEEGPRSRVESEKGLTFVVYISQEALRTFSLSPLNDTPSCIISGTRANCIASSRKGKSMAEFKSTMFNEVKVI